jgi:hypothetical protein
MHSASSSKSAHTKGADTTKVQSTARVRVPLLKLPAVLRTSDLVVLTIITGLIFPLFMGQEVEGAMLVCDGPRIASGRELARSWLFIS